MRRIPFLILVLFSLFLSTSSFAFEQSEELVWLAIEGQKRIFERNYAGAMELFRNVEKDYPMSAVGPFGQMAVFEVRMLEREDFHLENEFMEAAKRGEAVYDKVMQLYHPSDLDLFFAGGLIGLEGFFKARKGQWWGAYTKGNTSRQIFTTIIKRNPDFVDAEFGLGMYTYWRSVFTNEIKFLPFFADRRAEGIAVVEKVARQGNLARDMAKVNLGIIYFEEKRYEDAAKILQELLARFPKNAIIRNLVGRIYLADKKYDQAIAEFRKVLEIDPGIAKARYLIGTAIVVEGKKERYPEAERELQEFLKTATERLWRSYALYWLGQLYEKQGNSGAAKEYYGEAIKLNPGLKSAKLKLRGLGGGI